MMPETGVATPASAGPGRPEHENGATVEGAWLDAGTRSGRQHQTSRQVRVTGIDG